jgi:hypothetical protein
MKNLFVIIIMLFSIACNKDNELKSKMVTEAPFDEFWLSTRFDYSLSSPTSFTNMQYYNIWAGKPQGSEYYYMKESDSDIKINYAGDILTIETYGDLKRTGDKVPVDYIGDPDLWDGLKCNYYIKIQVDISEDKVITGVFNLDNGKFRTEQNIADLMKISKITNGETWAIGRKDGAEFIANADIRFTLDIKQ